MSTRVFSGRPCPVASRAAGAPASRPGRQAAGPGRPGRRRPGRAPAGSRPATSRSCRPGRGGGSGRGWRRCPRRRGAGEGAWTTPPSATRSMAQVSASAPGAVTIATRLAPERAGRVLVRSDDGVGAQVERRLAPAGRALAHGDGGLAARRTQVARIMALGADDHGPVAGAHPGGPPPARRPAVPAAAPGPGRCRRGARRPGDGDQLGQSPVAVDPDRHPPGAVRRPQGRRRSGRSRRRDGRRQGCRPAASRDLVARDAWWVRAPGRELAVGRADRRRRHPDQHLVRPGRRLRQLGQADLAGSADPTARISSRPRRHGRPARRRPCTPRPWTGWRRAPPPAP